MGELADKRGLSCSAAGIKWNLQNFLADKVIYKFMKQNKDFINRLNIQNMFKYSLSEVLYGYF